MNLNVREKKNKRVESMERGGIKKRGKGEDRRWKLEWSNRKERMRVRRRKKKKE